MAVATPVIGVGPAKRGVDDAALGIDGERETPVVHAGAVLPTVAFPCLMAGLAWSRYRMKLPHLRTGARVVTTCVSGLARRRGFAGIRAYQEQVFVDYRRRIVGHCQIHCAFFAES